MSTQKHVEQLKSELSKMQDQINELSKKLENESLDQEPECIFDFYQPYGESFFVFRDKGLMQVGHWDREGYHGYWQDYVKGELYKRKQQAYIDSLRRKTITEWNLWAKYYNEKEGWKADWYNETQRKFCPYYDYKQNKVDWDGVFCSCFFPYEHIGRSETCQKIIDKIGQERMKLIFGVE